MGQWSQGTLRVDEQPKHRPARTRESHHKQGVGPVGGEPNEQRREDGAQRSREVAPEIGPAGHGSGEGGAKVLGSGPDRDLG